MQPILTTVIDLNDALGGDAQLLLGGGLGLYLKQLHLDEAGVRTLLPFDRLPRARTTQDIDLFLRAEVIGSAAEVRRYKAALNRLEFTVDPEARWMKFQRIVFGFRVELDLMVGPLSLEGHAVEQRGIRARPRGEHEFHARITDDAVGVEFEPMPLTITGQHSDGSPGRADVFVPRAFPYTLMKLGALRDRIHDEKKEEGRHHALDLYRIVGMLTMEDLEIARRLSITVRGDPAIEGALTVIDHLLATPGGLGRVRLREHPLCPGDADPDWLATELRHLLAGS